MHKVFVFVSVIMSLNCLAFGDDDNRFLFEATIEKDDGAVVHSGPGTQHYATSHLQKGERVKVIRKDSDGWLMIAPPRGSFSWVSSAYFSWASSAYYDHVDGHGTSTVKADRVAVYVGSELHPEAVSQIQVHLSKGDTVKVIGTQRFRFNDGPREMFKIHPVRGEYRWIHRDSIGSHDETNLTHHMEHRPISQERDQQHFEGEVVRARTHHENSIDVADDAGMQRRLTLRKHHQPNPDEERYAARVSHDDSYEAPPAVDPYVPQPEPRQLVNAGKSRLSIIDHQFRDMVRQDVLTWDLDSLERKYLQLEDDVNLPSMKPTIHSRLDAVHRYRAHYRDYVDFERFTAESKRRDAELMAQQTLFQPQLLASPDQSLMMTSVDVQPVSQVRTASFTPNESRSFDGAGIVRRLSDQTQSGPRFALVSPGGRTLAFLQPTSGIDLNRYEGRAMGIIGHRFYKNDWRADAIVVSDLQPVQLNSNR